MKRSNLFLGATTGLLAIASFAFAKSQKTSIAGHCLTIKSSGNTCAPVTSGRFFTVTAVQANAAKCRGANVGKTVVTAACQVALKVTTTN
jgi:hypothetical protein